jgi:hypothetical protein
MFLLFTFIIFVFRYSSALVISSKGSRNLISVVSIVGVSDFLSPNFSTVFDYRFCCDIMFSSFVSDWIYLPKFLLIIPFILLIMAIIVTQYLKFVKFLEIYTY